MDNNYYKIPDIQTKNPKKKTVKEVYLILKEIQETKPYWTAEDLRQVLYTDRPAAYKYIKVLKDLGIVELTTPRIDNTIYLKDPHFKDRHVYYRIIYS